MLPRYTALMASLGLRACSANVSTGDSAAAIGARVGAAVIAYGNADGSRQQQNYANADYAPVNAPLAVFPPPLGNPGAADASCWQPLQLEVFVDQSGNLQQGGAANFLTAEWGRVVPFAMSRANATIYTRPSAKTGAATIWPVYNDPGAPVMLNGAGDALWRASYQMTALWSAHLDPADGVLVDISPAAQGNSAAPTSVAALAGNLSSFYRVLDGGALSPGYAFNPVTGEPYAPNVVLRGDYARVLAEFWADGPAAETPPGHWFTILHYVRDSPLATRRMGGVGAELDPLEFDVKAYLALGGAMHDSAISMWGAKGWYDTARPVTVLRWQGMLGQSSDPQLGSYHPDGIGLVPGRIELVTPQTTAPGQRHAALAGSEGQIAILAYSGPVFQTVCPQQCSLGCACSQVNVKAPPAVSWILGVSWFPYQRVTFVTPPFAGYTSGHSGFSRAAAHVLTLLTGSRFFPGGMGSFVAPANEYLIFETGPSANVTLQWASYFDAADQCALSRIWGGIHPPHDDLPSRGIGDKTGPAAFAFAQSFW
jgi:hypothetical protein